MNKIRHKILISFQQLACSNLKSLVMLMALIFNFFFFSFYLFSQNASVGINNTGIAPNISAILDVSSTSQGALIPRMSTAERNAIIAPIPESLLIYNTDKHCFEAYYSGQWVAFGCLNNSCRFPVQPRADSSKGLQTSIIWKWTDSSNPVSYKWGTTANYSSAIDMGTSTSYTQIGLTCSTSYTAYVWAYNDCGSSPLATLTQKTVCKIAFTTATAGSTFIVPTGVTSITIKVWGAGGGGYPNEAGGGGFAQATFSVTPGQSLNVLVGGAGGGGWGCFGGVAPSPGGLNGGGEGGYGHGTDTTNTYYGPGGGGGGYSAVKNNSVFLIQAGGGGGGGTCGAGDGGAGGGISGLAGTSVGQSGGGHGGTNTTAGAGGFISGGRAGTAGSGNNGGKGGSYRNGGGGGGGGHFGGGGGGADGWGSAYGGGGGGGSAYVTGTSTIMTAGSGSTPGNNMDPDYVDSAGQPNYPGLVVIEW